MATETQRKIAQKSNFKDAAQSLRHIGTVSGGSPERYYTDGESVPGDNTDLLVCVNAYGVFFFPDCGDPGFSMTHPTWDALVEAVAEARKEG